MSNFKCRVSEIHISEKTNIHHSFWLIFHGNQIRVCETYLAHSICAATFNWFIITSIRLRSSFRYVWVQKYREWNWEKKIFKKFVHVPINLRHSAWSAFLMTGLFLSGIYITFAWQSERLCCGWCSNLKKTRKSVLWGEALKYSIICDVNVGYCKLRLLKILNHVYVKLN